MGDFSKRQYGGTASFLQADVERAISKVRGDMTAGALPYSPKTPADWEDPAPSTIGEAIDRLAARLADFGGIPIP